MQRGSYASILYIGLLLFAAGVALDASAATQRMLLLPQTISIASGSSARADAMCLDSGSSEPKARMPFTFAPATVGSVTIAVERGPPLPLQEAIERKIVSIEGTGDFESMSFRNLVPGKKVEVHVPRGSVVAPDSSYPTADLVGLPQLDSNQANYTQDEVWVASSRQTAKSLGFSDTQVGELDERVDMYSIYRDHLWTRQNSSRPVSGQAFVVYRGWSYFGPPRYVLLTGAGTPRVFVGNGELSALTATAMKAWGSPQRSSKPRIVLVGEGTEQDFDAARLTMEVAAGGSNVGTMAAGNTASPFSFEPPTSLHSDDDRYVYDGRPWRALQVVREPDKRTSAQQAFYDRGFIKVYSRTAELLGKMAATVRNLLRWPELRAEPRHEIVNLMQEQLQDTVDQAFSESEDLRTREVGGPEMLIVIDAQTTKQTFALHLENNQLVPSYIAASRDLP